MTEGYWDWKEENTKDYDVILKMWKRNGKVTSTDLRHIADMLDGGYTEGELV